jgi:replicative DNA helicase
MSKQFNVESGLISKLLETKDMLGVKDAQIKATYFSGEHRRAFQFIYDSVINDGEVPTVRAFERKFPNYPLEVREVAGVEVVGTEESLKYWCNELRKKVKHNSLAETVEEVVKHIEDFDTDTAYSLLKKEIAYIESEVEEQTDVDITKNTEDRIQAYLKRKENKGMLGLPYGIKHLDYITKGLKKETLTTLIANTGVGKTWFEILIGAYCQLQNCRVLQFVTEMSEEIMRDRYEAMLFSMMYGDLNYNSFKSGNLSLDQEKKYFEFLENDLPNCEPLIIATASGVMGVSAEIDKHKPDIVLIDGVYLMEDDQGAKDDWLRVAHITRDLKKLAKRCKLPIFINTQADKNTSKRTGPELGSIMYTQAIGQDSDDILALYRDEVMISDREMCLKVLKQREGVTGKVMMSWDFDTMNFGEIYAETAEADFTEDGQPVEANNVIGVDSIE